MNANRKADLQRKLAVAPLPKPPAGLAERIKTEIPKELRFDIDRERDQFSRSLRVSLAVAASVIVVIASAFLALHVMESANPEQQAVTPGARTIAVPPARQVASPPPPAAAPVIANQPAKPKLSARKKAPKQQPAPAVAAETRALDAASSNVTASAPGAAGGVVGGVAAAKTMQAAPAPLRDLSREEKIRVFKDRLAHGADPKVIAKEARDAGLNDFADELEKKKP